MVNILAFSAKKQGGKSTAVEHMKHVLYSKASFPVVPVNFADPLREAIWEIFFSPCDVLPRTEIYKDSAKDVVHPCGKTFGQLLQVVGTDWVRTVWPDCWLSHYKHTIEEYNKAKYPVCVLTSDVRFPNEVHLIQDLGGKVIRFTRTTQEGTRNAMHASEVALDSFDGFDAVIDNNNMNIEQQNKALDDLLAEKGWLSVYD
jgi:hypothetical protein